MESHADVVMHYGRGVSSQRATYHSLFLTPSIDEEVRNTVLHTDSSEVKICDGSVTTILLVQICSIGGKK